MFITYILYSNALDKYYIGYTSDINARIIRHNQSSKSFTERTKDWVLVTKKVSKTNQRLLKENVY